MRSSYIYVVMERGEVEAAFTVKHELESWWDDNQNDDCQIFRVRACDQEVTDITNEL